MTTPPEPPRCAVCGACLDEHAEVVGFCDYLGRPVVVHLYWRDCWRAITGREWQGPQWSYQGIGELPKELSNEHTAA
jgi:hypothetical protein